MFAKQSNSRVNSTFRSMVSPYTNSVATPMTIFHDTCLYEVASNAKSELISDYHIIFQRKHFLWHCFSALTLIYFNINTDTQCLRKWKFDITCAKSFIIHKRHWNHKSYKYLHDFSEGWYSYYGSLCIWTHFVLF